VLAISLTGITAGSELCTFGKLPLTILDEWVEINPTEVKLQRTADVYLLSRRIVEGRVLTWIGLYRPAYEIGGSRPGGYHGAGIWLLDKMANGEAVARLLPQLVDQVNRLAMTGGQFQRRLADIRTEVRLPDTDFDQVRKSMEPVTPGSGLGSGDLPRAFLDLSDPLDAPHLGWFIYWVQAAPPFARFNRIVLSTNRGVAAQVADLNRLKVLTPGQILREEAESMGGTAQRLATVDVKLAESAQTLQAAQVEHRALLQQHGIALQAQSNMSLDVAKWQSLHTDDSARIARLTDQVTLLKQQLTEAQRANQPVTRGRSQLPQDEYEHSLAPHYGERDLSITHWQLERLAASKRAGQQHQRESEKASYGARGAGTRPPSFEDSIGTWILLVSIAVAFVVFVIWPFAFKPADSFQHAESKSVSGKATALKACSMNAEQDPTQQITITTMRPISLASAADSIYQNACSQIGPECKEQYTKVLLETMKHDGHPQEQSGALIFGAGIFFSINLPRGCNANEFEDASLAVTYPQLMPSGGKEGGVAINRFLVQKDALPGEYRYRLLLTQTGQRSKNFQGNLQFVVNLQQDSKKVVMTLPAEDDKEGKGFKLNFRDYQRIEGRFRVALNMVVKSVQVRVFENGSNEPKLTQTANAS
jgi:hypothetical protein